MTLLDNGAAFPINRVTDFVRRHVNSQTAVILQVRAVDSSAPIDVDDEGFRPRKSDTASATFADTTGATPPRSKRSRSIAAAAAVSVAPDRLDAPPNPRRSPFLDTFGAVAK